MARLTIVTSNAKKIGLHSIYRHEDIDNAVEFVREQLHELLDKHIAQEVYNKRYKLKSEDIVQDFNGDRLYMAMCIRDVYNDDLHPDPQVQEEIQMMGDGLIKPHKKLLAEFSRILQFPEAFFLREGKVDREHTHTFMCTMPHWAG